MLILSVKGYKKRIFLQKWLLKQKRKITIPKRTSDLLPLTNPKQGTLYCPNHPKYVHCAIYYATHISLYTYIKNKYCIFSLQSVLGKRLCLAAKFFKFSSVVG